MAIEKKTSFVGNQGPELIKAAEVEKDEPRKLEPTFGLSEGTRQELEMNGYAISPFTGAHLVGTGTDDVREVDAKEYHRIVKEAVAKREAAKPKGMRFPKA